MLLTEQQAQDGEGNPNQTQTIGFDSAGGALSGQTGEEGETAAKGDLEENVIVNENNNAKLSAKEGLKLPTIDTDLAIE